MKKSYLDALKFRNAVIGINNEIQMMMLACSLGFGNETAFRSELMRLNTLCEEVTEKKSKEQEHERSKVE